MLPSTPDAEASFGQGSSRSVKRKSGQKRTTTGCLTCRKGRKRCDETKPTCLRCTRLGTLCIWPVATVPFEDQFRPYPVANSAVASSSTLSPVLVDHSHALAATQTRLPTSDDGRELHRLSEAVLDNKWLLPSSASLAEATFYTQPSDPFEHAYPNAEERVLIRHFLYFLPTIPAALPPENSTELEIFLPAFATQDFLSVPRGTSQASDSVALAVFSLASIHLAYLHRSSALDRLLISRPDLAAVSISLHQRYTSTATALQQASLALARAGLLIEASQIAEPSATTKRHLDYLAFATNLCVFSHVLAGGTGFRAALDLSHAIANARGGPRGLLEGARQTGDLRTLRRMRATLENDVAWEVFSSFSNGRSPEPFSEPISSWFFSREYLPMNRTDVIPGSSEDWSTFETMLGMSRPVFDFLLRFVNLYASARGPNATTLSRATPTPEPYLSQAHALLVEMVAARLQRLPALIDDKVNVDIQGTPLACRIRLGDLIWLYTLEMVIHRDLLALPPPDPTSHEIIISLVEACGALPGGLILGLMWPLIVAGGECKHKGPIRRRVRRALDSMRYVLCCFNLDSAFTILNEVWALRDAPEDGNPCATWRDTVRGDVASEGLILF